MAYQPGSFKAIPVVVKNLLIINVILFAITYLFEKQNNIDLTNYLGLHYFSSDEFRPYQFVTYMFMHGGLSHIFFNMFALFMFGNILEQVWGPKRFLIFYMVTGVGAAALYMGYQAYEFNQTHIAIQELLKNPSPEGYVSLFKNHFSDVFNEPDNQIQIMNFADQWTKSLHDPSFLNARLTEINQLLLSQENMPMIGASGAIFGILIAFGMLFPNTELFLMFIPIPIKAKYAIAFYAAAELFFGVARFSGDNIAHFAHLGGALVGFVLVKIWQKRRNTFY